MRHGFFILILLVSPLLAKAQAEVKWEYTFYENKNSTAANTPVTIEFPYTNIGDSALLFKKAVTGTKYLTVNGLSSPVNSGNNGTITISFLPKDAPLEFQNEIRLIADNPRNNSTLHIHIVQSDNPKHPEILTREKVGSLLFKRTHIDAGEILLGKLHSDTIQLYNPTDNSVTLKAENVAAELGIKFTPEVIQPHNSGYMVITVNELDTKKVGKYFSLFNISTNGELITYPYFAYQALFKEDFSNLTQQELLYAPKIVSNTESIDFGTIKSGDKYKCQFQISNHGKQDLEIREIYTGCGCTTAKMELMILAPGKSTTLNVIFDSFGRSGMQTKSVTILTNDPSHPTTTLYIMGEVL